MQFQTRQSNPETTVSLSSLTMLCGDPIESCGCTISHGHAHANIVLSEVSSTCLAVAEIESRMSSVKHKVLVLSGKGGVGKSTFAAHLARGLAEEQNRQASSHEGLSE